MNPAEPSSPNPNKRRRLNYLQDETPYGVGLLLRQEIWVPPATGRSHHIALRFVIDRSIEPTFIGCVSDMSDPLSVLEEGDEVTFFSEATDGVICYGSGGDRPESERHLYESGPFRDVPIDVKCGF